VDEFGTGCLLAGSCLLSIALGLILAIGLVVAGVLSASHLTLQQLLGG
jgi:hypothetical protein